jgi:hypothetical protein
MAKEQQFVCSGNDSRYTGENGGLAWNFSRFTTREMLSDNREDGNSKVEIQN